MILGLLIFAKLTLYGLAVFRLSLMGRRDSLWLALPVAAYATLRHRLVDWVAIPVDICLLALALSALSVLLNQAFPKR